MSKGKRLRRERAVNRKVPADRRHVPGRRVLVYDVDLYRMDPDPTDPDDDTMPGWYVEAGEAAGGAGVDFGLMETLAEIVVAVEEELRRWRARYNLRVVWRLGDDEDAMAEWAAREGVELPRQ